MPSAFTVFLLELCIRYKHLAATRKNYALMLYEPLLKHEINMPVEHALVYEAQQ
jgi:hypothetical protein